MAVMKPDTFDVENKGVSNRLGLIKRLAVGWKICCCYTGKKLSMNGSEAVFYLQS